MVMRLEKKSGKMTVTNENVWRNEGELKLKYRVIASSYLSSSRGPVGLWGVCVPCKPRQGCHAE